MLARRVDRRITSSPHGTQHAAVHGSGVDVDAAAVVAGASATAVAGAATGVAAAAVAAFFAGLAVLSSFNTGTGARARAVLLSPITLYGERAWRFTHSGILLSSTTGAVAAVCASAASLISTPRVQTNHR